jgi:hypothetical protein
MTWCSTGASASCSWSGYLTAGDIIRPHTDGTAASTGACTFTISKVGKPNVTGVNVTPFIEIPQPERQSYTASLLSTMVPSSVSENIGSGLFSVSTVSTKLRITALKTIKVNAGGYVNNAATAPVGAQSQWYKNGSIIDQAYNLAQTGGSQSAGNHTAVNSILNAGEYLEFFGGTYGAGTFSSAGVTVTADALSDQILTPIETFSTDTNSLTYASSSAYTISTLANAPVGTFITYTYAINSNTRTQTTTAPTQTTTDMNTNGIQLTARAYNAASTAALPAVVAIQIGKGMKGLQITPFGAAAKTDPGDVDFYNYLANVRDIGVFTKAYDEKTGILYLDAGYSSNSACTAHYIGSFNQSGGLNYLSSAYFVINASKNPALAGLGLNRIAASAINTAGTSIPNTATPTVVTYDSTKIFDTHGALNTTTGIFTVPETGYYQVNAVFLFSSLAWTVNNYAMCAVYKNGVAQNNGRYNEVPVTATRFIDCSVNQVVYATKGDTIDLRIQQNRTGGASTLNTAAPTSWNQMSIVKVSV